MNPVNETIILREMLLQEHSRRQMLDIVAYIGRRQKRFDALIGLLLSGEYRVAQRAAWPLSYCTEACPAMAQGHFPAFIAQLEHSPHHFVRRNILRLMQFAEIPKAQRGRLMTICFDLVLEPSEPVAIKAFALKILGTLAKHYPDIRDEIKLCIEDQLPHASAGFRSSAQKVLRQINA